MRKEGKENYNKCDISWSVYGESGLYRSEAWVTIHAEDTIDQKISGDVEHNTIEEAEGYIIDKAKKYVDAQISLGAFKPIK